MADPRPSPIAIIGIACRLPGGSDNPDKLWDMLSKGRSGWREIPADRWNKDAFYHPDPEAKEAINTKSLYFLDQDISAFDARFFNIHPHEAHCLDPQQRILMETTYEALENAGQTLEGIKGSDTSVHVGAYATDFERMGYKDISRTPKAHMIGTGIAILSNRISYVFDLKGPSSTVDTGCSGSMVALHQACHGLRARESKMAIVAGTQLVLTPDQIIPMSSVGMTNPDGKCYVFDSRGAGYARGEGVVTLILKRLEDAVSDGDNIHAIIRNSGLNQDGKTAGLTLPNSAAQANLIRQVYRNAGLSPAETAYVEAHGTGTQAGDSAEISSIAEVFTKDGREGDLYVGSIKSNIGHLEASSGVAGLLKAILILKHGEIPPNIDFIKPKPTLHLDERKIKIATEMVPFPESTGPRRVSVNSFGYGGTNAHVILEALSAYQKPIEPQNFVAPNGPRDAHYIKGTRNGTNGMNGVHFENGTQGTNGVHVEKGTNGTNGTHTAKFAHKTNGTHVSNGEHAGNGTYTTNGSNGCSEGRSKSGTLGTNGHPGDVDSKSPSSDKGDHSQLFVLSARSEASLQTMVSNLHQWVSVRKDQSYFRNLAYTLSTRRTKMQYRFSTAASTHDQLLNQLEQKPRITKSVTNFRSVFLFTGQGAQWHAMGRELTLHQPVFRKSMWKSDSILKALGADWSLIDELSKDEKESRVGDAEISQPSTTAIQIALVDLLKTFGVSPDLVLGHSSGEIAAAYAAEALEQETALEISYRRGFMSKACARVISSKGAMMAVGLGEHDVQKYIEQTRTGLINVACVNSPVSTTISGDETAIDELKHILDEESIFNRKLKVDTAYHSHHMKKVASEYLASIARVKAQAPNHAIKFYSSVSVTQKTGGFDAQYWVDNLVSPVRFGTALDLLVRNELVGIEPAPLALITEIGPHGALAGPVRQTIQGLGLPGFKTNYLPTLVRGRHAVLSILETAGKLFEFGYPVALEATLGADGPAKPATLIDDLSPYSWDHSTSYLYESNLSKQHRFRAHPPHDLLGLRVAGTTNHEPTWRNFLGVDSLPWLRDHVVDGFAIYPAAAYLSMAIEAARQIAIDRKVQGVMSRVHLKNVTFSKSIMIPERRTDGLTSDVEVMLTLRPAKHLADRTWETFRIMALSTEDVWHEHCSGSVMIEWAAKEDEVEGFREEGMTISSQLKRLQDIKNACDTTIDHDQLYANFAENGNVYGPTFNGIQSVQVGPLGGIANIVVPDAASVMPKQWQQPHLIHPASFDAVFQLGIPLYRRNVGNGPVMPTGLDEVSINCNLGSEPGTKWVATTTLSEIGVRFAVAEIMVFEETAEGAPPKPMITIKGGSLRGIGEAPLDESALPFSRKMSYRLKWQPDVDYLPLLRIAEQSKIQSSSVISELVAYMQLLIFKQPHMKILELGAGNVNGDVAQAVLETVDRPEGLLLDKYSHTNINAETLEQGKVILQKWVECVDFKALDISKDPVAQGFREGEFDLIIASDALQGVSSLEEGLVNSRKLLKTGGRLIVVSRSPSTSKEWQSRLTTNHHDFHPVHVATSQEDDANSPRLIVATTSDPQSSPPTDFPPVNIICESKTAQFAALAQAIQTCLTRQGFACCLDGWPASPVNTKPIYIVLDDVANPLLAAPSAERFTQIVSLLTRAKSVLWLSAQGSDDDVLHPSKGMINGLARVVRRENAGMRLVTVNVQEDIAHPESLLARILDVVSRSFDVPIRARRSTEDEYTFSNRRILIPRVHTDFEFNDYVTKSLYPQRTETGLYQQADRPLKLDVETPGLLNSLRFVDDDVPSKTLGPFDLELEARAYGINFKDVFIAMGQMVPGVTMTGECAGIVRKVGSALTDQYRVGDRVCGIGAEPFSSHPRIDGNLSGRIPPWMSFAVGASIPIIFCTAYRCIVEIARLQRGQTILIHAASGGVGQAAIQLAQNIGAEIFCTVGSRVKRQLLIDNFNIQPSHIFSSRLRTFKQGILRLTQNRGVDCVLNSLSGESLHDSFAVLAPLGTFVEIGKSDIYKKNEINMVPFDRNVTFAAVDLTVLAKLKRAEMRVRLDKILSMFEEGTLQAVKPITTTPMTDIEEAFRLIQSRKHTGKVVLICEENTEVKLTIARRKPLILDNNGSYVIAGGLGDLGRRIAKYLAAHGAGYLVTLSRRKLDEEDQLNFERELQSLGAELHIIGCDITDKESVQSAAAYCSANLPPVRGIVHAGMVLRDRPFEIMSHDDYVTSLKPKVQGTQNLDAAFGVSDSLDFFIMLSSITAILGTAGQSNYAVGNAFQDAFAQSKVNSKCRYVAVNLGAVNGSLAITSLPAAQQEKMRLGTALMSFEEVFTVLDYAMSPQVRQGDLRQLILGFDRKSMESIHDEMALANPVFSQIPYLEAKGETAETGGTDIGKMLQQASTPEEIQSIVVGGICQRFAMFTARAPEDISPDVSMENFGLDSLIAIELKNWLVRTFQTTLQTSEVLDASDINGLARTIASRSKFVAKDTEPDKKEENGPVDQALIELKGAAPVASRDHDFHCCKAFKSLNKMPLNDFETIFDDYLENSKMFFTPEEFQTLERDVAEFRQPGSMGRVCYDRLHQQAHDPKIENWQDRYFLQSMYLQRRMPLAPFNNFMAFHPLGMEHTQAERAALIAKIAFQCKQDLEADKWEPMAYLGTANCTDLWQYIFNTARLPGVPLDRMAKFPGNDHIAVFHRGHIYKVDPIDGNQNLSIEALTKIFQSILDREDVDENWTSILSADDRTSWAENREALIKLDPTNKAAIDMVEASAFLVCLDETAPTDAEDRIRQMMMRDGFNRWVDKSIAFVVCKNATSGTYVEHTMIDAMTLYTMQTAIVEGITTYKPPRQVNGHSNGVSQSPQEFRLKTNPALEDRVLQVRERFMSEIKKFGYRDVILSEFGKEVLLDRRLPIKGVYDLMCLLANYYYYGYNAQSWEAVSMSHYHKGRPDIVQVNTPKTAYFCTIADDDSIPARERFEIMLEAANARNQTIKDAFMGHCYQRTLRALELCVEEGEEVPALFKNPLYEKTVEPDQMFGNTDGLSPESCFIMQNPKKFWMTYYVTDAGSHFSVITGKEEVIAWADCLQRASAVMKTLIDAA